MGRYLTPMEHAERIISHYLCLRQLPPKVIESIKKRIVFEIKGYARIDTEKTRKAAYEDVLTLILDLQERVHKELKGSSVWKVYKGKLEGLEEVCVVVNEWYKAEVE